MDSLTNPSDVAPRDEFSIQFPELKVHLEENRAMATDTTLKRILDKIREEYNQKVERIRELEDEHDTLWASYAKERDKRRDIEGQEGVRHLKRQIYNLKRNIISLEAKQEHSEDDSFQEDHRIVRKIAGKRTSTDDDDDYVDDQNPSDVEEEYRDSSVDPTEVADYLQSPVRRQNAAVVDNSSDLEEGEFPSSRPGPRKRNTSRTGPSKAVTVVDDESEDGVKFVRSRKSIIVVEESSDDEGYQGTVNTYGRSRSGRYIEKRNGKKPRRIDSSSRRTASMEGLLDRGNDSLAGQGGSGMAEVNGGPDVANIGGDLILREESPLFVRGDTSPGASPRNANNNLTIPHASSDSIARLNDVWRKEFANLETKLGSQITDLQSKVAVLVNEVATRNRLQNIRTSKLKVNIPDTEPAANPTLLEAEGNTAGVKDPSTGPENTTADDSATCEVQVTRRGDAFVDESESDEDNVTIENRSVPQGNNAVGYNANKPNQKLTLDSRSPSSKRCIAGKSGPATVSDTVHTSISTRHAPNNAAHGSKRSKFGTQTTKSGADHNRDVAVTQHPNVHIAALASTVAENGQMRSRSQGASPANHKLLNSKGRASKVQHLTPDRMTDSEAEDQNVVSRNKSVGQTHTSSGQPNLGDKGKECKGSAHSVKGDTLIARPKSKVGSSTVRKRNSDPYPAGRASKQPKLSRENMLDMLHICTRHQKGNCCQRVHMVQADVTRILEPIFAPTPLHLVPGRIREARLKEQGICHIYHLGLCCKHEHMSKEEADQRIADQQARGRFQST